MQRFELRSSAFGHEGDIPDLYTCRGKNISPPLSFGVAPKGTESFALKGTLPADRVGSRRTLLRLVGPHILAEAELLGYYSKKR
jgi:phosphatidylethanolamine-binding protein (PEBP) family uncharacterized protein